MQTGVISSVDEIWGTLVDGKDPPEYRHLLVKVRGGTEDVTGGVSSDAKPTHDQ